MCNVMWYGVVAVVGVRVCVSVCMTYILVCEPN